MKSLRWILLLICLLAASCASDKDSSSTPETSHKSLSQRLSETGGYKADADGNWIPRDNKRSSFESEGASRYSTDTANNYGRKDGYKTGEYAKKSWWGNKNYDSQAYSGNTDGSRFRKDSDLGGKGARESGGAADVPDPYQTGNYATSSAREQSKNRLDKPSDAETNVRRRVFQQPDVIDWREQRTLSLEQSKGILGR